MEADALDKLMSLLREIRVKVESDPHLFVVVEGVKDKFSLQRLGIGDGSILTFRELLNLAMQAKISAYGWCRFIILSDFDRKGEEIAKRVSDIVQPMAATHDSIRKRLRLAVKAARGPLTIEGLANWLKRKSSNTSGWCENERAFNGEICHQAEPEC